MSLGERYLGVLGHLPPSAAAIPLWGRCRLWLRALLIYRGLSICKRTNARGGLSTSDPPVRIGSLWSRYIWSGVGIGAAMNSLIA